MQNASRLVLVVAVGLMVAWFALRGGTRGARRAVEAPGALGSGQEPPAELTPPPGNAELAAPSGNADESVRTEAAPASPEAAVPAPSTTWRIHGTVTDAAGVALPRAKVWTWGSEAVCDARGGYELVLAQSRGQHQLFASAPRHTETEQAFSFPPGAHEVRVDLALGPAFVVRGTVTDADGNPVEGARVTSFYSRKSAATSALDGSFELDSLDPGRDDHSLFARKDGYVQADTTVDTEGLLVEGVQLVLRRGTPVEGFVLGPGGAPLADVSLYIGFSPHAQDRLDAKTDARGAFSFPNVDHGERTLVAELAGYGAVRLVLDVPKEPPGLPALELRLEPARWVGGVVRDAAGQPLAGISVAAQQDGEYLEVDTVRSDKDGRFKVDGLPAKGAGLELYGQGVVRHDLELTAEQLDRGDLVVVLERSGEVAGLVVDAATRLPVERFTVHFVKAKLEPGDQGVTGYSMQWVREGYPFSTKDGTWTSRGEDLRVGAVVGLEVRAEGYAPARHRRVLARPDFAPADLVFELAPGGTIAGVVLDADGAPVAGAHVFAVTPGESVRRSDEDQYRSGYTVTGADGRFVLAHVPPGPTKLTVFTASAAPTFDGPFEVERGREVVRTVRLGGGAKLLVRALDASAAPVVGVKVRVTELGLDGGPTSAIRSLVTDAAGEARFVDLTPGYYRVAQLHLEREMPGFALQTELELLADEDVTVRLQPTGDVTLTGRVVLASGEAVPRMGVFATFTPGPASAAGGPAATPPAPVRGTTTEAGEFRFEGLERGPWMLQAALTGDGGPRQAVLLVDLGAGPVAPVTLRLE